VSGVITYLYTHFMYLLRQRVLPVSRLPHPSTQALLHKPDSTTSTFPVTHLIQYTGLRVFLTGKTSVQSSVLDIRNGRAYSQVLLCTVSTYLLHLLHPTCSLTRLAFRHPTAASLRHFHHKSCYCRICKSRPDQDQSSEVASRPDRRRWHGSSRWQGAIRRGAAIFPRGKSVPRQGQSKGHRMGMVGEWRW
jgi:hypothetical protein